MCVVIDANAATQSIGRGATEAGSRFLEYVSKGRLVLAYGGAKFRRELAGCGEGFRRWLALALSNKRVVSVSDEMVATVVHELKVLRSCRSNDVHVVALARVANAGLVFTNDRLLQSDCQNVLGAKVYTTNDNRTGFTHSKRDLLNGASCALT